MRRQALIALATLALLAACGKKVILKPGEGHVMPPKGETSALQPTVNDLLTPDQQAVPGRDNELVSKSEPLQPDRFDLPPPG
jgi:predicted small lipoprotein YifL